MNNEKVVLLVTSRKDPQAKRIFDKIKKKGRKPIFLNPETPTRYRISIKPHTNEGLFEFFDTITKDTVRLQSSNIKSIYSPSGRGFILESAMDEDKEFVRMEYEATLVGSLLTFNEELFWINNPIMIKGASYKIRQLSIASKIGLKIPDTLITNDRKSFNAFFESKKEIIGKIVNATATRKPKRLIPTRIIDQNMLQFLKTLKLAPVQFQNRIEKQFDIRINVIGNTVFATEIHSNEVDSRFDVHIARHKIHNLPHDIEAKCIKLCQMLGLSFGAIDMIKGDDYYFLEINPSGKWGWIEEKTGVDISGAFARLLTI